eukprot:3398676-Rhodomonas_salina.1
MHTDKPFKTLHVSRRRTLRSSVPGVSFQAVTRGFWPSAKSNTGVSMSGTNCTGIIGFSLLTVTLLTSLTLLVKSCFLAYEPQAVRGLPVVASSGGVRMIV